MFGNPSYPTYQAFLGLGIAAAIAMLLMPWWIKLLKVEGIGQQVRADGPKRHLIKQGTLKIVTPYFVRGIPSTSSALAIMDWNGTAAASEPLGVPSSVI